MSPRWIETTKRAKLLVIGNRGTGKTALLNGFAGRPLPDYIPTVFEGYVHDYDVDGVAVELAFWDSVGDEDDNLRALLFPNSNVILLVFSVGSPDSLRQVLDKWAPEASRLCPDVPTILVGTKSDLRHDMDAVENLKRLRQRPVSPKMAQTVARTIGALQYMECSALTRKGIPELLHQTCKASLGQHTPLQRRKCVMM